MPCRTAAGVFGIARTMAPSPSSARMPAMVRPAMIDSITAEFVKRAYCGSVSAAFCGLTASTTAAGAKPAGIAPASATTVTSGPGAGGATGSTAIDGDRPRSRQPASMAPPILPKPTSRIGGMVEPCAAHGGVSAAPKGRRREGQDEQTW